MATLDERVSRLEGGYQNLAFKTDIANLRFDITRFGRRIECGLDTSFRRIERRLIRWMFAMVFTSTIVATLAATMAQRYLN